MKKFLKNKCQFLHSTRFWKLVIVAIANLLATEGIITMEIAVGISTILLGSVVIRTVDRAGEKIGK